MTPEEFMLRVLQATAFDATGCLWWRVDSEYAPVTFFINCNDFFWWGTADCERVTPDNVGELEKAIADAKSVCPQFGDIEGPLLFCARMRNLRPMDAQYDHIEKEMWPLFDACGPERPMDNTNHPSKKRPRNENVSQVP